ncbi:MAG: thioredoxin family protein [Deltaproteobacteria bacterium]|nr:thioredoxin family protein [Deltaproteobacteria bacterium]
MLNTLILAAALSATPATRAFDTAGFDALQKNGQPVVVLVAADWCPTCRAQDTALKDILAEPEFASLTLLRLDFDGQRDMARSLKANSQSTLIVFKAGKEMGRTVGDADPQRLAALLRRAL